MAGSELLEKVGRLPDWTTRIGGLFAARSLDSFVWGRNDCALFAADAVHALTGADFAEGLRGAYDGADGAARVLEKLGGLDAIADSHLPRHDDARNARVGDIGLVDLGNGRQALGVCGYEMWHVPAPRSLSGPGGLAVYGPESVSIAWRVG